MFKAELLKCRDFAEFNDKNHFVFAVIQMSSLGDTAKRIGNINLKQGIYSV